MKNKFIILLACFMSIIFLGCGNNIIGKNETSNEKEKNKNSTLQVLTKIYESEGLKLETEDKYKDYDRVVFKSSNDEDAFIYIKDNKVVSSSIEVKASKNDMNKFKILSDFLIKEMIPDFNDYNEWLKYMISLTGSNSGTQYHWDRNGMHLTMSYGEYNNFNKIILNITDSKNYNELVRSRTEIAKLKELNKDGKLDGVEFSKKSLNDFPMYQKIYLQIANLNSITEIKQQLDKMNVKYSFTDNNRLMVEKNNNESIGVAPYENGNIEFITYVYTDKGKDYSNSIYVDEEGKKHYMDVNNKEVGNLEDLTDSLLKIK